MLLLHTWEKKYRFGMLIQFLGDVVSSWDIFCSSVSLTMNNKPYLFLACFVMFMSLAWTLFCLSSVFSVFTLFFFLLHVMVCILVNLFCSIFLLILGIVFCVIWRSTCLMLVGLLVGPWLFLLACCLLALELHIGSFLIPRLALMLLMMESLNFF